MNGEGNTCKVYDEEVNSLNDECENVFRLGSVRKKWSKKHPPSFLPSQTSHECQNSHFNKLVFTLNPDLHTRPHFTIKFFQIYKPLQFLENIRIFAEKQGLI